MRHVLDGGLWTTDPPKFTKKAKIQSVDTSVFYTGKTPMFYAIKLKCFTQ